MTQMSINWRLGKQIMVHLYIELYWNIKEWSSEAYNNMDETQKHYVEQKKLDPLSTPKGYITQFHLY